MNAQDLGERIREARKRRGLTQAKLGEPLGLGYGSISNWERGISIPRAEQLHQICLTLNVSADDLLGLKISQQRETGFGLQWRVVQPGGEHDLLSSQEIRDGIELFHLICRDGLTTSDIQEREQFRHQSPAALARLLEIALFSDHLALTGVERDEALEAELLNKFGGLKHCYIAKLDGMPSDTMIDAIIRREAVAFVAAQDVIQMLAHFNSVGMTGGSPISRFVDLVRPSLPELRGITWLSLLVTQRDIAPIGLSANSIIARMLYKQLGADGHLLPFLNDLRRTQEYYRHAPAIEQHDIENAFQIRRSAARVEAALVTVGSHETDYDHLGAYKAMPAIGAVIDRLTGEERGRCVGDVLLRLLDEDGQRVGNAEDQALNDATVFSIELEDLRRIANRGQVWVLAARYQKASIIRALLRAGLANCLVIENMLAKDLLR